MSLRRLTGQSADEDGDRHLRRGERAVQPDEGVLVGEVAGSRRSPTSSRHATITSPSRGRTPGSTAPNQPRADRVLAGQHRGALAQHLAPGRDDVVDRAARSSRGGGSGPRRRAARRRRACPSTSSTSTRASRRAVDHAVVGDDEQPGRGRQRLAQLLGLGVDHRELLQPLGGGHAELVPGPVEVGVVDVGERRAGAADALTVAAIRSPTRSAPTYVAPRCEATRQPGAVEVALVDRGDVHAGAREPAEGGRVRLPLERVDAACPTTGG